VVPPSADEEDPLIGPDQDAAAAPGNASEAGDGPEASDATD